jgi:hypothetical protein
MAAMNNVNSRQFGRTDLRTSEMASDTMGPANQSGRTDLRMTEPELVKYPHQMGAPGRIRLGFARVRTAGMSPMKAGDWAQDHGYDRNRVAYGKGISDLKLDRKSLPKSTRSGW